MPNNRDTQFKGFAKALFIEIASEMAKTTSPDVIQQIIARRSYDLVDIVICHISVQMSNDSALMFVPRQDAVSYIPDMTELPQEEEKMNE